VREVLGEDWPDDRLVANVGRPLQEQMQVFSPQHSDELYRVYREWNHANTSALLLAYPGVEDALRELRDAGRRLGIVTSKSRDAVDLAWGVLPRLGELFGSSVHHCPHCDGYEYRGQAIGVYGQAGPGVEAVLAMLAWSDNVVLFTDGRALSPEDRTTCDEQGVVVNEQRIIRLDGRDRRLERVVLADGSSVPRAALFLVAGQREQSDLAKQLGCEIDAGGVVVTDDHGVTTVPGIYAAGDASIGEQMVVVAAAQGAIAATKIHTSLWEEDLRAIRSRRSSRSSSGTGSGPVREVAPR